MEKAKQSFTVLGWGFLINAFRILASNTVKSKVFVCFSLKIIIYCCSELLSTSLESLRRRENSWIIADRLQRLPSLHFCVLSCVSFLFCLVSCCQAAESHYAKDLPKLCFSCPLHGKEKEIARMFHLHSDIFPLALYLIRL